MLIRFTYLLGKCPFCIISLPLGIKPLYFTLRLIDILEISSPIGVFLVTSSTIPLPPLSLFLFCSFLFIRSFGAGHCAPSSEGFLATFTPALRRGAGVVDFDYRQFSQEFSKGSFHFDFRKRDPIRRGFTFTPVHRDWVISYTNNFYPGWYASEFAYPGCRGPSIPIEWIEPVEAPEEVAVRLNLMTTAPSLGAGILVALNPTDEGRIGTGRNTPK